jgi:lipid-binding SYLF domain-containing protein
MKTGKTEKCPASIRRTSLFIVVAVTLSFAAGNLWARTVEEIDASVYACLGGFYNQIMGGREMVAMAEGVLVMPGAIKGGLIVGGEYGKGALRVGGRSVSYYNLFPPRSVADRR